MKHGVLAINAGQHPMEVKDALIKDSYKILEKLDSLKKDVKKSQLKEVATISSGDPLLGELISDAIIRVGADGGIITEKAPVDDVEREYVDGYYLQNGFQALQAGKKELVDPFVVVAIRRFSSAIDIIEVMTNVAKSKGLERGQIPRILFIGNIEDAAYNTVVENINRGTIDAVIVKTPPMFGEMGKLLLEDVAVYANCQPITDGTRLSAVDASFVGSIDKIVATKNEATLFANNETEAVKTRVQEIKDQIETEVVDAISEKLKDRVAKLEGKIALFRIGGATDSVKEEVEFRVEDAIHATRAAYTDGIVAGGGITLLELSKLDISETYRKALQDTFKQLLINANLPAELKLDEALKAPKGFGFNLREGGELVDMVKSGIIDPALVVREVIKNATASAGDMLAIGSLIIFENTESK
jgi:chaperonin GroEL